MHSIVCVQATLCPISQPWHNLEPSVSLRKSIGVTFQPHSWASYWAPFSLLSLVYKVESHQGKQGRTLLDRAVQHWWDQKVPELPSVDEIIYMCLCPELTLVHMCDTPSLLHNSFSYYLLDFNRWDFYGIGWCSKELLKAGVVNPAVL